MEVDKPDLKKGPVLMKKPVGGVTKGEKGSQVNEKGPAKPQAGGQKLMEDLGTLFTEVGFGGGVQGQPSGRLSRALDQGMSDLKDGKRGKRGNKMPSSMGDWRHSDSPFCCCCWWGSFLRNQQRLEL